MTEQEKELIIRLWDAGLSGVAICKMLPYKQYITKKQIYEMKQQGILLGHSGRTKEKTEQRVIELHNSGYKPKEIAQSLNLKLNTVLDIYNKLKIKRAREKYSRYKPLSEKTQNILQEIKIGTPIKDIVDKYKVSNKYVYKLKKKVNSN